MFPRIRLAIWSTLLLCSVLCQSIFAEEPPPFKLRVMTYNLHHGEGTDGKIDLERIAKIIRDANVSLVALQEVDRITKRTGGIDQAAEIARRTKMSWKYCKAIPLEGGEYGQAILSTHSLGEPVVLQLPGAKGREQRIAAFTEIEVKGRKLLFGTTHLDHEKPEIRESQAKEINRIIREQKLPALLAGDLNATPDSSVLKIFREEWSMPELKGASILTSPSHKPARQIDYILSRAMGEWSVSQISVPAEPVASDHLPLVIEWTLQ